ncbi:hypothetical protein [Streptomyces canus]|uniref:hypothetical protein n=1 Tax=Streptomyces canus TaxID=58343 RepID=UPI0038037B6F
MRTIFARVLGLQLPDGLGRLAQRIRPLDGRGDFARLGEFPRTARFSLAFAKSRSMRRPT